MNLVYDLLNEPYLLEYGEVYNITIENINEYRQVVDRLENYDYLTIIKDDKLITNFEIIKNTLNPEINKSKLLSKIIKDLTSMSKDEFNYAKTMSINQNIQQYMNNLIFESDYPLKISEEFDFNYLAKCLKLEIIEDYDSFIEQLISYLDLYLMILNSDIFITFNITQILENEEIKELIEFVYKKNILLINFDIIYMNQDLIKNQLLFDKDLCRIL
ncbi:type II-A CRISPR-associated protein Csn2 [Helcococcus kunzii]|uniref:type II-A CRISPR-associated protein Csn2 n=1 Tax=Helcococcus kunzii TaxID=40091 RepID=UPI0038ACFC9A